MDDRQNDDRVFGEKFGQLPPEHVELMWNDATNIYIVVILLSFLLIWYFKKNKRKLLALLPYKFRTRDSLYADTTEKDEELKRVRLRQQLEMYYKTRKYESGQMPPPGQFNNGETVAVNIT